MAPTVVPVTIDFAGAAPGAGNLDVRWIHGSRRRRRNTDPAIQVHQYDRHTFVLRQNKAVHYEAPFLYLLCGNDRALLLDTGASADPGAFPLRATVDGILRGWLAEYPRRSYGLVVAHTHAHGDHIAADGQFADRPDTTVVGTDVGAVREFFGLTGWPEQVVGLDLGGRVLDVTGIPGHHETSIAVYDPWSGFLLTGDTVLPGRLYVQDYPTFLASLDRLVDLCATRQVTHVMGCHVEMTRRPGRDYPLGATYQPREAAPQMTVDQLRAVRDAAVSVADRPGRHRFDDVIIFNDPGRGVVLRVRARALWNRVTPARLWPGG